MPLAVSVVISTFRRPGDLIVCLDSIRAQSLRPLEVIVVDNDARRSARAAVVRSEAAYREVGVALRYETSTRNSPPVARNLGVGLSRGDVVLFLDDDVVLEPDYVPEIVRVYEARPTALGVQGYIVNCRGGSRFWRRLFFLPRLEPDVCRVLPSLRCIYPERPTRVVPCEYLSGCNASYRRAALAEFPQDERLVGYSFGEDLDQAYRVFTRHPDGLWMTPHARCVHNVSPAGRTVGRARTYTIEVYGFYLSTRLFPPTLGNRTIYWWSGVGRLLGDLKHPLRAGLLDAWHRLGALVFCMRHRQAIRAGRFDVLQRTLST